jgi:hypothetical protein
VKPNCEPVKQIFGFLFLVCLFVCSCHKDPANVNTGSVYVASRFQPGQVWTFHAPNGIVTNATLTVVAVDPDAHEGHIIYVSVAVNRPVSTSPYNFFAISEGALDRSVVELIDSNRWLSAQDQPFYQDFYVNSHELAAQGKADTCFKVTVAEVLEAERKENHQ